MRQNVSSYITSALGLALAGLFLFFTFRGMDLSKMGELLGQVHLWQVVVMSGLCFLALVVRGFRWYYLLPQPRRAGEVWACQRALAVSYGINNLASRVGEVVRIVVLRRDTGRGFASITATVAADRIVFDSLIFVALAIFSLLSFKEPLLRTFPQLEQALPLFAAVTLIGLVGMIFLGGQPRLLKRLFKLLGITRIEPVWRRLEPLLDQVSQGLSAMTRPREMVRLYGLNIAAWLLAFLNFMVALQAFGISAELGELVLLFTVASLGFILPSPGGVGTFHYFMTLGCTTFLGTEEAVAAAAATVCHGINFLVLSVAAVVFFMIKAKVERPDETDGAEMATNIT